MMKKKFPGMLVVSMLCAQAAHAQSPAANTATAASRDLWLGTEGRYVRQWLLLGPMSAESADSYARLGQVAPSAAPPPDAELAVNGSVLHFRVGGSYGDVLEPFAGTGMKDGEVGFALTTVERDAAGDASLLLGGNVCGVWANGSWVGGGAASPAFVIDGTEVKVRLRQGSNFILLRIEQFDRPALLTMRVVSPGFVGEPLGGISPYIPSDARGTLRVFSGARPTPNVPKVAYVVIAPGGRVVADATMTRDHEAQFSTTSWPDGPYEVRATTQNALGDTIITHLPWYQGDVGVGAKTLLDAAAQPSADGHVKMLADMIRDRTGGDWRDLHSPLMEYAELDLEGAGKTGGARDSGFVRLAWIDEIDGSAQFCRAYLPDDFSAGKPLPAMLFLHGYNPPNPPYVRWWSIADRYNSVAERHHLVVLEPMGRGNVDYRWMGERDVLRCLAEAQKRFPLDGNRIYLSGESMGGNGTWLISSRNPQLFAAAAPVFGGWDYRINQNGYNYTNPDGTRPMEAFLQEAHSSFAGAEGLLNVPLFVLHGDKDAAVPVEQSRHGVRLLQRWGYDIRYREIPGRGHEDIKARDQIADWLLAHRRDEAPREVRLRSYDLAGARAHWVQVTSFDSPLEMIEARAVMVGDLEIRLDTRNVNSVRLTPPLIAGNQKLQRDAWQVIWNGERNIVRVKDGALTLNAAGYAPRAGDKSPVLEGRLTYFFGTPFAIVVGTGSKDPVLRQLIADKAQALSDCWERWQHVKPRVYRDIEVTPAIERQYSLLLIGGPSANKVSARIAPKLPMKVTGDSVTVDGRRFEAHDAVAQMLYRHPANAARYVLLVEPTSTTGLRYWNPQQYWHVLNGFPLNLWDWTIVDGRHVAQSPGLLPDRGWVAAGVFDTHWRRDDRFTVTGDESLRAKAPLRQAPAANFKLPPEALDEFVGDYSIDAGQIGSGGVIRVARSAEALLATAPESGMSVKLEAEDANDFAIAGLQTPVSFRRNSTGRITGLQYNYNGQELMATRRN
jgi:dienelactone hydrolase